ncbi:MAG: ankyrin repeat protein [Myxococcota bacterium]|jgi:ankyrin repeat protein
MYHIFLNIVLITAQNQIDHVKGYSWDQEKIVQYEQRNSDEPKDKILKKDSDVQIASEVENFFGDDLGDESWDGQDIISQLRREEELEEKSLAPDLESLGLDELEPFKKDIPKQEEKIIAIEDQKKPTENLKEDREKDVTDLPNAPLVKRDSDVAKIPESEKLPSGLPTQDNPLSVKKDDKANLDVKNNELPEIKKDQEKTDKKSKSGFHPIEKIKEFFKKKLDKDKEPQPDIKEKILAESLEDKKIDADKDILDLKKEKLREEIEAKNEEERQKRIDLEDLKEIQRMEKMQSIRKKYLQQSEEDVFEGIGNYKIMSQIVPKAKILPKFINKEVPPPLLNRIRNNDNRYHPFMMSNGEKVDFMFKAIARNLIADFNALYALNKKPNIKNHFGDTLLTFSTIMGRHDAMSSILSKGSNPDLVNDLGYTPLNIAIELIDYKSVEILIDMGAKVDLVDSFGRTYLMQAARVGSLQMVDLLISKGVGVNVEDRNGDTALSIAFKFKQDIIAKYLAKFGAKSFIKKDYKQDDSSMIEDIFDKWR